MPPVVELPKEEVISPPYVPPPSVSVKPEVEMNFTPINARSVEIHVDAPASRPLSSYDYNPVRTEYNPLRMAMAEGVNGPYVAPKSISVEPMLNLGGNIAVVENQTYADIGAIPFNQDNIVGLQPNITYAGNAPVFALVGQEAQFWSEFPAVQTVDMAGYGMTGLGNVVMNAGSTVSGMGNLTMNTGAKISNLAELNLADGDIRGCSYLQIDAQILTADPTDLLLNGIPIATINQLPKIEEWANYDAINNIVLNGEGISGQPFGVTGSKFYGFSNNSTLTVSGAGATANLLFNGAAIGGTGTGPSQWAKYPAIQNVDFSGKEITNINKVTFNTAAPLLGGASINALNDLNFSLLTAAAGQANINGPNNIAFWNPNAPGVPGFYVNLYSKNLTYNGLGNVYLASDTRLAVPSIYLGGIGGLAGGKLEVLGANAVVATINGQPCSASWSQYPCSEVSLNMNHNQIISCRQIDFAHTQNGPFNLLSIDADGDLTTRGNKLVATNQWATFDAVQDIDAAQHNLVNVPTITFANPANSLSTNAQNQLTYNGQVVQSGNGNIANWAQYNANHDVVIPAAYALSINPENTLNVYRTSQLNTNIAHGTAGNNSSPNFTSYPTDFTVNSARKISLNTTNLSPLVSGIGLNSATTINIDCLEILTLTAGGDVNLFGAITSFEIGEFNIAAANWNVEAAALEWATGAVAWNSTAGFEFVAEALTAFNAPLINFLGGAVNFQGGLVTITAGGLSVLGGGVSVAAGGVSIAGGGLQVGGGVANLNAGASVGGTLTAGTIAGVNTLAGAGTGAVLTNIASINGFVPAEAQKTFKLSVPRFNPPQMTGLSPVMIYASPTYAWNFTSKPVINVLITGHGTTSTTTPIGFYMQILYNGVSLTNFNTVQLLRPIVANPVTWRGDTYITATWNDSYDGNFTKGTPFQLQLYARPDTGLVDYGFMSIEVNMTSSEDFA